MDRNEAKKMQDEQTKILLYIDRCCRELKIEYYLIFGSLLGAVRHGGSIPWDADIDIGMKRNDYETLRDYLIKSNSNNIYFYEDYSTEKHHTAPHALLRNKKSKITYYDKSRVNTTYNGLYVDIFPIDEVPYDFDLRKRLIKKIIFYRKMIYYKEGRMYVGHTSRIKKIAKTIIKVLLSPFSYSLLCKRVDSIMKKYNGSSSGYVAICTSKSGVLKQFVPENTYGKPKLLKYDQYAFPVPNDYDKLLSLWYDDYMKLPPENQRWEYFDSVVENVTYME